MGALSEPVFDILMIKNFTMLIFDFKSFVLKVKYKKSNLGEKMEKEKFKKEIKLISRTEKYKGNILKVYEDKVEINGKSTHFDYIENFSAVGILPILSDGKIILVRQYRLAVDDWTLEIPAGKLDVKGEEIIDCAKRELEEETGYKSDNMDFLVSLNSSVAYWKSRIHIFIAKDLYKGNKKNDDTEETICEVYTMDELKKMIYEGIIYDSKTITSILLYDGKGK